MYFILWSTKALLGFGFGLGFFFLPEVCLLIGARPETLTFIKLERVDWPHCHWHFLLELKRTVPPALKLSSKHPILCLFCWWTWQLWNGKKWIFIEMGKFENFWHVKTKKVTAFMLNLQQMGILLFLSLQIFISWLINTIILLRTHIC